MSLRKSPRRTRALLAANRRNSRKSTGPRTFEGKWHSSWNAVRHYRRTQFASCIPIENREIRAFEDFLFKLREAIIPADNAAGTKTILLKAAEVWRVKRSFDRWIETRTEEDWLVLDAGAVPRPRSWRLKLRRPGLSVPDWTVTASVCLRWGRSPTCGPGQSGAHSGADRGRGSQRSTTEDDERPERLRMHTLVSVHSTGPRCCSENGRLAGPGPAPPALSAAEEAQADPRVGPTGGANSQRTKPESTTIQSSCENMSDPRAWDPDYAAAYALAERIVGWLMGWGKRTKPESPRNQEACKNMSPAGERRRRNPKGRGGATSLGKAFQTMKRAVAPGKEYSQMPLFQTKPEYYRKDCAYKNMSEGLSRIGGWLGAAASILRRRSSNRPPVPPVQRPVQGQWRPCARPGEEPVSWAQN